MLNREPLLWPSHDFNNIIKNFNHASFGKTIGISGSVVLEKKILKTHTLF